MIRIENGGKHMPNLKFSVPYNNNFSLLRNLITLRELGGNRIEEIYLSGPQTYFGSGRVTRKITVDDIIRVIRASHEHGISVNLSLNSTCEGLGWYSPENISRILKLIRILHMENDLDAVTIANPLFIRKIRAEFKKIKITASVLSGIDSVQRAMFFDKFDCDVITLDRDINRNLNLLEQIKEAIDARIKLLVDECCLFRCPYRIFHDNYTSHYSKESYDEMFDPFTNNCRTIEKTDPSQLLKSPWIRPEDTGKYSKITDYFKIEGRTFPNDVIVDKVKSYLMEKSSNNLPEYFRKVPDNFFYKVSSCDKNCYRCRYCDNLAKRLLSN